MPRCTAETFRGRRCRNNALVDEDVCTVHYRLREERAHQNTREGAPTAGGTDGPRAAPANDAPRRRPGEADQPPPGEASGSPEGQDPGDPSALEGLTREHQDAAAGPVRDRVEIDPRLFEDLEAEEPAEAAAPAAPRPPPRGALLEANPGPWSPSALEGLLVPAINRRFSADDVAELEGAEAEVFLEATAASLNRIAARVDPNNPFAALVLSSSIMLGTRYVPRMIRARRNGSAEDGSGDRAPEDGSAAAGSSAEESDDGGSPTLADQVLPASW